jgi:hypothetical protein
MKKYIKSKLFLFVVLLSILASFAPADTFACACCSNSGHYSIRTYKPEEFHLDILQEMKFDKTAELFLTEADFEMIKGLDAIREEMSAPGWVAGSGAIGLTGIFTAKNWKLNFKTPKGKTGTLTLPVPVEMLAFKVDIHDGKTSGGGGPLLYKEWRFKGNVQSGTGFLQAGIAKPTSYFLVFQGRGNGCDDVSNFTNWHLEINGAKAKYEFFGKLSSGDSADENKTENQAKLPST